MGRRCARLEKVARINTSLQINKTRLEDLRDRIEGLHSIQYGDRVQKSGSADRIADSIAEIVSIEGRVTRETAELEKEKQFILEEIQRLEKPEYVEVLYCRYVALLSWKEIMVRLHYSKRHTLRLHEEALEAFENASGSPRNDFKAADDKIYHEEAKAPRNAAEVA